MPVRERLERFALFAVGLLLLAFLGSFGIGLFRPATRQGPLAGPEPAPGPAAALPVVARGRVEVLNGSGRVGLARQATEQLRSGGFDVVYFGTAAARADSSEVLDRADQPAIARAAADRLGIARVRSVPDTMLLLDATVVLGRDWPKRAPAASAAPGRRGWWGTLKAWLGID